MDSPWSRKELDMTERLSLYIFKTTLRGLNQHCLGIDSHISLLLYTECCNDFKVLLTFVCPLLAQNNLKHHSHPSNLIIFRPHQSWAYMETNYNPKVY